ncbi:hypothetical protein NITLEN_10736 [Nitrospira lenta]|uniref:Uncharacterized protein n=1 Tax=Nitrospira lenta TaxID=1436998 RepID=A0A330L1P5_9BACT|nr:hypothetical protein NITLEN_10736 [Nitrospira lenta]
MSGTRGLTVFLVSPGINGKNLSETTGRAQQGGSISSCDVGQSDLQDACQQLKTGLAHRKPLGRSRSYSGQCQCI